MHHEKIGSYFLSRRAEFSEKKGARLLACVFALHELVETEQSIGKIASPF